MNFPNRERRTLVRKNVDISEQGNLDEASTSTAVKTAQTINDIIVQLQQKNIEPWQVRSSNEEEVRLEFYSDCVYSIPKYTVVVNSALEFSVFIFNWPVPDQNPLYKESKRSVMYVSITELLKSIQSYAVCEGLAEDMDVMSAAADPTGRPDPNPASIVRHSVPKAIGVEDPHFKVHLMYRSVGCEVLTGTKLSKKICKPCMSALNAVKRVVRAKSKSSSAPAKPRATLAACGPEKLRATVASSRLQMKDMEDRLQKLQQKIEQNGVGVSETLEKDVLTIMGGQNLEVTPHMKFFWQEQMKLLQSSKMGRRYHPQVIRFALSIHSKSLSINSKSAYRELRESGALILPSEQVLRDYKNYFKPKAGINKENVESLREKSSSFSSVQRYVAVIMDEMKIQSNLVFDKVSGDLVGFIDLGDPMTNFASLAEEDDDPIATHALAFLVRGLCTDLKHIISYFFTGNVTSF